MDPIIDKLNTLAAMRMAKDAAAVDVRQLQQKTEQEIRLAVPELFAKLDACRAELTALDEECDGPIQELEAQIKAAVRECKQSVRGEYLQAVYTSGRTAVDVKGFLGYCMAHPEAKQLITVGEPSVSLRTCGR